MGMFDSFYDENGVQWQTKALDCHMDRFSVGDRIPRLFGGSCQMKVLGNGYSLATVKSGVLVEVPAERGLLLPLVGYHGDVEELGQVPDYDDEELVERVAEAIHNKEFGEGSWGDWDVWQDRTYIVHGRYMEYARAALSVVKEAGR